MSSIGDIAVNGGPPANVKNPTLKYEGSGTRKTNRASLAVIFAIAPPADLFLLFVVILNEVRDLLVFLAHPV